MKCATASYLNKNVR